MKFEQPFEEKEETVINQEEKVKKEIESNNKFNNIEAFKNCDNFFDEEKARKVVEVIKNWANSAGSVPHQDLYEHLVGKHPPALKARVDYKVRDDGDKDWKSYQEAREKRAKDWTSNVDNRSWVMENFKFKNEHNEEREKFTNLKTKEIKRFRMSNYSYDSSWIYYNSNYYIKNKENNVANKYPESEAIDYRVYFNPRNKNVMPVFNNLIDNLESEEELRNLGFQIKTRIFNEGEGKFQLIQDIEKSINRRDRIVLYLGEKGINIALPLIKKYIEENRDAFNDEGVLLGQPFYDKEGNALNGACITSEIVGINPYTKGKYETFNELQSQIIEEICKSVVGEIIDVKNRDKIKDKFPQILKIINKVPQGCGLDYYLKEMLSDNNVRKDLERHLVLEYPEYAKKFGLSERNIAFKKQHN